MIRVHVLKGEAGHWHGPVTRLGWLGPAQPHGLGWAQPAKKIYLKKNLSFLQFFICCILINSGLYFYTVKIRIRY
jgi:hypothetical protein